MEEREKRLQERIVKKLNNSTKEQLIEEMVTMDDRLLMPILYVFKNVEMFEAKYKKHIFFLYVVQIIVLLELLIFRWHLKKI